MKNTEQVKDGYNIFAKNLTKYGITVEDFKTKYIVLSEYSQNNEKQLPSSNTCICGTRIIKHKYVINPDETDEDKRILVVGSCCIKKFMDINALKKQCKVCNIKLRNNISYLCVACSLTHCHLCYKEKLNNEALVMCDKCVGIKHTLPRAESVAEDIEVKGTQIKYKGKSMTIKLEDCHIEKGLDTYSCKYVYKLVANSERSRYKIIYLHRALSSKINHYKIPGESFKLLNAPELSELSNMQTGTAYFTIRNIWGLNIRGNEIAGVVCVLKSFS